MNIESSPGRLPGILLLPCVMEVLQLWISRASPFMHPNHLQMIQILGWANSETWIWAWVVTELVSTLTLPYLHPQTELSSTVLARPTNAAIGRRHRVTNGQLSRSHALRVVHWQANPSE